MAQFDQQQSQAAAPNFTGYSQGIHSSPNTALGTLFEGLAGALDAGVKEADRNIQANIKQDIFDATDAVRAEFGVPEATDLESDATDKKMALPGEIQRASDQLEYLQSAVQQGKIRESNYWARMNNVVRQLRGKYPGYRAEIDQMVASITGTNPANALRSALMNEWENNARESKSKMDSLVDWATKQGQLPADFIQRQASDNPYSFAELQAYVSTRTRDEQDMNVRAKQLAYQKEINALTDQQVKQNASADANQIVRTIMSDMSSSIGKNTQEIRQRIAEAQRAAGSGQPLDQASVDQIRPMIAQLRADITLALHQRMTQPWDDDVTQSYVAHMKPEEVKAIIDEALTPVTIMEQAIGDEKFGILGSMGSWFTAQKLDSSRALLQGVPYMQAMMGAMNIMGADSVGQIMALVPATTKVDWEKAMIDYFTTKILPGGTDPNATIDNDIAELDRKGGSKEAKNDLINKWQNLINSFGTSEEVDQAALKANVRYMFSPSAMRIWNLLDTNSAFNYFSRVASPAVTQKMLQMRQAGDTESYDLYQRFVASSFQTLFMQKVQSLQSMVADPTKFDVRWDPVNSRFVVAQNWGRLGTSDIINRDLATSVSDLNSAISVVKPVLEDAGGDTGMEILSLLYNMGYNPEAPKAHGSSFAHLLSSAIWSILGAATDESKDAGKK